MIEDLEPQAAAHVGQLIFAFARLDFLLALALRNVSFSPAPSDLNPLIERLGFKERLDALGDLVSSSKRLTPEAKKQFASWCSTADRLRATRNSFVHGRWGVQTQDTLYNASTKVGKALTGEAKYYSLEDLEAEVGKAKSVLAGFDDWHSRYVVSAA